MMSDLKKKKKKDMRLRETIIPEQHLMTHHFYWLVDMLLTNCFTFLLYI